MCDCTVYVRCINLGQARLGNTLICYFSFSKHTRTPVADPGENLTGAIHSNFGRSGYGGCG